jgi:hypothetical protein
VKISAEMNPAALKDGTVNAASIPAEVVEDIRARASPSSRTTNWNAN